MEPLEAPPPYTESVSFTPNVSPSFAPNFYMTQSSIIPTTPFVLPDVPNTDSLTFVDFIPPGSPSQQYDNFRVLVDKANHWLCTDGFKWKVKTCETVQFALKETGEIESLTHTSSTKQKQQYMHGLRLWIIPGSPNTPVQSIDYLTLIPKTITHIRQGVTGIRFQHLPEVLDDLKTKLTGTPLPGKILSLDSRKTYVANIQKFDPECTYFCEERQYETHYMTVLRLFYEKGTPAFETLEVSDFFPSARVRMFFDSKRENVSELSHRAFLVLSKEISKNPNQRLVNIQTMEVEVKSGKKVLTSRMKVTEENQKTEHVRYIRTVSVISELIASTRPLCLESTCKTFIPIQIPQSTAYDIRVETMEKTKERVEAWIKATGADVICAETVQLRSRVGENPEITREKSETLASSKYQWLTAIRFYFNGAYQEPHPEMLPSLPKSYRQQCQIT